MTIPVLLIGVLIAMGIFATLGWSAVRAVQSNGSAQKVHLAHAALIVLGMAAITLEWPRAAQFLGLALTGTALWAVVIEERWTKLLPLFGVAFGIALILGLPFAGG